MQIEIKPQLLDWAIERSMKDILFIKTITANTLEGKTLYREAMQLLNIKNIKTFKNLTEKTHPWIV